MDYLVLKFSHRFNGVSHLDLFPFLLRSNSFQFFVSQIINFISPNRLVFTNWYVPVKQRCTAKINVPFKIDGIRISVPHNFSQLSRVKGIKVVFGERVKGGHVREMSVSINEIYDTENRIFAESSTTKSQFIQFVCTIHLENKIVRLFAQWIREHESMNDLYSVDCNWRSG